MERAIRPRTTPQLTVISTAIQGDHSHPSAEDIYLRVRKVLPRISLGTVYRTLQRLVREGTIQMLFFGERTARYDPTLEEHDHFICQQCGRVEDVRVEREQQMDFASLVRAGFTIAAHSLAIRGVCQLCGRPGEPRRRPRRTGPPVPTKRERTH
ncbi:MAG: transcriptional repressor [Deltaproteobacteria bacterium]|nr:transcriptional repressor [Deltaproteobacteria bacterium]